MTTPPEPGPLALFRRDPRGRRRVIRLVVFNWIFGVLFGWACAGATLIFDFAGLRTLMIAADAVVPAVVLLFSGFAITFGGLVAATAVMLTAADQDREPHHGARAPATARA